MPMIDTESLQTITVPCNERAPTGLYSGYVCCRGWAEHKESHCITAGSVNPPGFVVIYEWSTQS